MGKDIDKGHILKTVLDKGRMGWLECSNLSVENKNSGAEKRPYGVPGAQYKICFASAVSSAQLTSQLLGLLVGTFTWEMTINI